MQSERGGGFVRRCVTYLCYLTNYPGKDPTRLINYLAYVTLSPPMALGYTDNRYHGNMALIGVDDVRVCDVRGGYLYMYLGHCNLSFPLLKLSPYGQQIAIK